MKNKSQASSVWRQLSAELAGAVDQAGKSVVAVDGRRGHTSSGILWRQDLVLTVSHAIRNESGIRVILDSATIATARLVGRDPGSDIALLRLDQPASESPAQLTGDDRAALGHLVVAVARTRRGHIVASAGILSGLMPEWRTWHGTRIDRFIRPDLTLYSGFSGGGLIGADGSFIGMNTGALMRDKPITIPASTLNRVAEALEAKGRMTRPYIGLVMQAIHIPESLQQRAATGATAGLLVVQEEPGGPADQAGILIGDLLLELDGHALAEVDNVADLLARSGVGSEVKITLIRGGALVTANVRIGEH